MKKIILALSLFPLFSGWIHAAQVVTYQGRLKESGLPVNANRSFTFELCATPGGTGCVASPDGAQSFQAVNGLFKSTFTAPAVDLAAGPWYLRVSVGGTPLSPLEMLTHVPYSVYASSAGYSAAAVQKTGDTMTGALTLAGSSLTVTGAQGIWSAAAAFAGNVVISSASGSAYGGIAISTHVYLPAGARYYGDGSGLTGVTGASGTDNTKVMKTGDIMTGQLTLAGSTLTVTGIDAATGYSLVLSSGIHTAGGTVNAGLFSGSGALLTNLSASNLASGTVADARLSSNVDLLDANQTQTGVKTFASSVTVQSALGISAGKLRLNPDVEISSAAAEQLGGVYVSSNIYVAGVSSAAKYYGDGSGLTGVTGALGTDATKVMKAGDTMTGQLTLAGSTLTVTGDAFSVGGSTLLVAAGKVGIGTNAPAQMLHVAGTVKTTGFQMPTGAAANYVLTSDASGIASWQNSASIVGDPFVGNEVTDAANGTLSRSGLGTFVDPYKLALNLGSTNTWTATQSFGGLFSVAGSTLAVAGGNVGIGTAAPTEMLHIFSNAANKAHILVESSGSNGNPSITVKANSPAGIATFAASRADTGASSQFVLQTALVNDWNIQTSVDADYKLIFSGKTTQPLALLQNGNIGIGTTSPSYRLHISSGAGEAGNILVISTGASNVVRMTGAGEIYANRFYGDGSSLTGVVASGIADGTVTDAKIVGMSASKLSGAVPNTLVDLSTVTTALALKLNADTAVPSALIDLSTVTAALAGKVAKDGDTMAGQLTLAGSSLTVTGNAFSVGGSTLVVKGGSVGIGTESPASLLDVNGDTTLRGNVNSVGSFTLYTTNLASSVTIRAAGGNAATGGGISLLAGNYSGGSNNATGGPITLSAGDLNSGTGGQNMVAGNITLNAGNDNSSALYPAGGSVILNAGSSNGAKGTLQLKIAGIEKARMDGSGYMGVGTTAPLSKFEVLDGSITVRGANAGLVLENAGRVISPETATAFGAGIRVSTNVYIVGFSSAVRYYGDGSGLTGVSAIDATKLPLTGGTMAGDLDMGGKNIYSASSVTAAGDITAARYQIGGSTVLAILPGSWNLGIGIDAGRVNSGVSNSFIGYQAGYSNTSGYRNTFVGYNSGKANVTGQENAFVGSSAGFANTGNNNAFLGASAGNSNTSGSDNAFVGYQAGYSNLSGKGNTYLGSQAGNSNMVGGYNTFVGNAAGYGTTGSSNTFVGNAAGNANWTGVNNAVVGNGAQNFSKSGAGNVVLGNEAGYGVLDNSFSSATLIGYRAGYGLATGNDNIFIGFQSGYAVTIGTGNIVIGYNQDTQAPAANNQLNIGGVLFGDLSARTIGISIRVPQAALDVVSTGTTVNHYAQIWRNSAGVVMASMTATGRYYGDGSGLAGVTSFDPSKLPLAGGTMAGDLNMGGKNIYSVSSVTAAGDITAARYQINGSTVLAILPGTGSLGVGDGAGKINAAVGVRNSFVGYQAGYNNTTAMDNVFVGYQAGYNTTTGDNSFVGSNAGRANTTGNNNSFIGSYAGQFNTSGVYNSFVGAYAGNANSTAWNNSFIGSKAGQSNSTGGSNSFMGSLAGNANTTGANNSFVGYQAGRNTQTGSANAIFGNDAGYGSTSNSFSSSTLMGYRAGYGLSTGSDNILLGFQSGYNITTGTGNIVIGYSQDTQGSAASNQLNIGGVLFGDLSARTIGISTRVPQAALDIVSTGTLITQYAQIWRNSAGVVMASMTATGRYYGDGSGLAGVSATDPSKLPLDGGTVIGDVDFNARLNVDGASTFVSSITALGSIQLGDTVTDTHGINMVPAAGTALSVNGANVSGQDIAKFYSNGSLVMGIRKK